MRYTVPQARRLNPSLHLLTLSSLSVGEGFRGIGVELLQMAAAADLGLLHRYTALKLP